MWGKRCLPPAWQERKQGKRKEKVNSISNFFFHFFLFSLQPSTVLELSRGNLKQKPLEGGDEYCEQQ